MNNNPAFGYYARIESASKLNDPASIFRDLRVVLEQVFRYLTSGEKRAFNGLYARTQFVFDTMQVPDELRFQINGFRILANKVAHEEVQVTPLQALLALKAISGVITYFFKEPVPLNIAELYAVTGNQTFVKQVSAKREIIDSLRVVVTKIGPLQDNGMDKKAFTITARADEMDEFELQFRQYDGNDLTGLQPILQPYQTLHLLNLEKASSGDRFYFSRANSMVVIEPDLLISISELAECFQQKGAFPLNYLVKKLMPQEYSVKAFQGNMVNALLDAVLNDPIPDFKKVFKEAVADQVFQAAAFGKESLNQIYQTVQQVHWRNVTGFASEVREKKIRIEPTFFAPRYGLDGRLDVLVEFPNDGNRKDIYELKSGSAPYGTGAWPNNAMQVVGYNMLLRSAFGPQRTGVSAIIYSAASENAVRHITTTLKQELELLAVRNQVVAWLLQLAEEKYEVLDKINREAASQLPSFQQNDYQVFSNLYRSASAVSMAYYKAHLSFMIREWLNAKIGMYGSEQREDDADGFAGLWLYEEAEKKEAFNIIPSLQPVSFDVSAGILVLEKLNDVYHNFRAGDTILIYPKIGGKLNPLGQQILKGRLDEIRNKELTVSLNNRQLDQGYFEQAGEWVLEHDIYESNYWACTRMLLEVLDAHKKNATDRLLGFVAPARNERQPLPGLNLNANQNQVIEKAFHAKDYFLIQGPPGTGKTSTIITRLVKELEERKPDSIMVVAFTNRAVDEIEKKLSEQNIAFVRFGSRKSPAEHQLRQFCVDGKIEQARNYIIGHRVFLSTVATLSSRLEQLRTMKVDLNTIIVDEASQLTEGNLAGLLLQFSKFVLVGDQNQLPPVVAQHPNYCRVNDAELVNLGGDNLAGSLFERLMKKAGQTGWDHAWDILKTHFRMHNEIADIINPWYGNQLESGRDAQRSVFNVDPKKVHTAWGNILNGGRLLFLPSPKEVTSKYHKVEAERVVALLKAIRENYGAGFCPKNTVGVVTPWRTQIAHIRQLLAGDEVLSQVNIETVERFQGSENDIIIVSLAIYHSGQLAMMQSPGSFEWNNPNGEPCTTMLDRKLLVTISRAKQQLILLADERAIRGNADYYNMIRKLKRVEPAVIMEEVFV